MKIKLSIITFLFLFLTSCQNNSSTPTISNKKFTRLIPEQTGISFRNDLQFDAKFNIYTYRNFYNGGGVGVGDFNNDGLEDIYFTSNQSANQLYLNQGNFKFKNITKTAGIAGTRKWSTGVAVADVNGDGWLDIYVCNSGDVNGDDKQNELFLNNGSTDSGEPTFTESAAEFGLNDIGHSTHAVFFDYDKDGDLDMYLLNNSYRPISSFNLKQNERTIRDPKGGDKFFRNDKNSDGSGQVKFTDVSEEVGIFGSIIGFGLGVTVGDINLDGYEDIYVSNDFFERDYLYLNQGNGTFKETLTQSMTSISSASMGADMADLNNDIFPEIFVTDMLPRDFIRYQTKTTFEDWNKYQYNLKYDYHHQFTRNTLQWNEGDGHFSERSRMADVAATDWSWGALMFDMDMDGYKDIFVANGIYQDLTDQDYIRFAANDATVKEIVKGNKVDFKKLIEAIPSAPLSNCVFQNPANDSENFQFSEVAKDWGLDEKGFSNGAAYADFDNDGDYDLVVNNVNNEAWIYQNNSSTHPDFNYLKIKLEGHDNNPFAIGSKVLVYQKDEIQTQQLIPQKGFQSSVGFPLIFGFGKNTILDSVVVQWSDRTQSTFTNMELNQTITIKKTNHPTSHLPSSNSNIQSYFKNKTSPLDFQHQENTYSDFDRDQLALMMRSTKGPALDIGDVNGDGLEDIYIGGAKDQSAVLFFQNKNGSFSKKTTSAFTAHQKSEDTDCLFFDADQDGDLDLYVCSGGSEFSTTSLTLYDRLYFNDGSGNFTDSKQKLPPRKRLNSTCISTSDIDNDGDLDLVVGEGYRAFQLGLPRSGFVLINNGKGIFTEKTKVVAPVLRDIGLINDLVFLDWDNDNDDDLVVVGEWMGIHLFENENGKFNSKKVLPKTVGFWNGVQVGDFNNDGFPDFVAGNLGWNNNFKINDREGLHIFAKDFDQRGGIEPIYCKSIDGQYFPILLKHDLEKQLPFIKRKYLKYENFGGQTMEDIFGKEMLENSIHYEIEELASCVFINDTKGGFTKKALPTEVQVAPIFAIETLDIHNDKNVDILLGGNLSQVKPEFGNYQSSRGDLLLNKGDGNFEVISRAKSGFNWKGDVRKIRKFKNGKKFIIGLNNDIPFIIHRNGS